MKDIEKEEQWIEPEDCDYCGCPACDFEDSDWGSGCWVCPECGHTQ